MSIATTLVLTIFSLARSAFAFDGTPLLGPSEEGTDQPLMWEAKRPADGPQWSVRTKEMIQQYGSNLLLGTDDIKTFCPSYNSLSVPQKVHFWAFLISAVTRYECYYDPAVRYVEPGMGNDPITGQPIASEGLLQLSYQDVLRHPYCNEFDWSVDSKLNPLDPKKTIFDPIKNLRCGIQILNKQIERQNKIGADTGGYWAVLIPKNKHSKITQIVGHLKTVAFCGH
ncbi:MAG: hypothetical protein V4760_04150 [Bdellovibrionota bacterium]